MTATSCDGCDMTLLLGTTANRPRSPKTHSDFTIHRPFIDCLDDVQTVDEGTVNCEVAMRFRTSGPVRRRSEQQRHIAAVAGCRGHPGKGDRIEGCALPDPGRDRPLLCGQ